MTTLLLGLGLLSLAFGVGGDKVQEVGSEANSGPLSFLVQRLLGFSRDVKKVSGVRSCHGANIQRWRLTAI